MASSGYLQVWEGAVRSSKTVIALMAFSLYVRSSKETRFLITGRTVATIEQNCILNDYGLLDLWVRLCLRHIIPRRSACR